MSKKDNRTIERLEGLIDSEIADIENNFLTPGDVDRKIGLVKEYNDILNDANQRKKDKSGKALKYLEIFVPAGVGLLSIGVSLYGYFLGMDYDRTGRVPAFVRDFWERRKKI